jgi:hypothetical protein
VSCQLHAPASLSSSIESRYSCVVGLDGRFRALLEVVKNRTILHCRESNPGPKRTCQTLRHHIPEVDDFKRYFTCIYPRYCLTACSLFVTLNANKLLLSCDLPPGVPRWLVEWSGVEWSGVEWSGVEWNLRPTVSRPVCFGVGPPFGAHDQILHVL